MPRAESEKEGTIGQGDDALLAYLLSAVRPPFPPQGQ